MIDLCAKPELKQAVREVLASPSGPVLAYGIVPAVTVIRPGKRLLTMASVLLLVLVPSADLIAFGVHEHVVVSAERGFDLTGAGSVQDPPSTHHCDLSVSVGELIPVIELPMPVGLVSDPPQPPAFAPQHRPLVPLTPPRT